MVLSAKTHRAVVSKGTLTLQAIPNEVQCENAIVGMTSRKPQPQPLLILNAPTLTLNPDGSYSFVPDVIGGLKDYEFSLETDAEGFAFNTTTGLLSRPPQ